MTSKVSISVGMQASHYKYGVYTWKVKEYVKLWQRLHVRTLFSGLYKTLNVSLIAFLVVDKGMAAIAGFHALLDR